MLPVVDEGCVALQTWLVGQLDPRTPHAADLFAQDSECLYDAFLSVPPKLLATAFL